MNKEMIDKLKTTWTAFGGLTADERAFLQRHSRNCIRHGGVSGWIPVQWEPIGCDGVVYRLSPDYVEHKKRWFFNTVTHTIRSLDGEENDPWSVLIEKGIVIEVQESDLPYLEKPEGEWEFRKAEIGDICLWHKTQISVAVKQIGEVFTDILSGYRWCKPRKTGRWVEYPIYIHDHATFGYRCNIKHINNSEVGIHKLPSIVGFGGVRFAWPDGGESDWYFELGKYECKNEGNPLIPIKARFWID